VSIVDLWAAEAFLVVATPKALKQAIETIIPKHCSKRILLSPNCWKANSESSTTPFEQIYEF